MLKLDTFRLFVDQKLAAATDDIFRRFARIIADYEAEVCQLKQEVDRKERLLERTGRPDRAEDALFGSCMNVLSCFVLYVYIQCPVGL